MSDPINISGPWEHKNVHAHGQRFHVASMGSGPLVIFLHGFPTFWWLWRKVLPKVADQGFTAVAMDLRGYGGSDHPPRGYDPRTLAADVSGVIKALGFQEAIIIGHGVGGLITWTAAALQTKNVRAIGVISAAHPNTLRRGMLTNSAQIKALSYTIGYQRPWFAERALAQYNALEIGQILSNWMLQSQLDLDDQDVYRRAFLQGKTAHCALEFHRWALRSIPRLDGKKFATDLSKKITVPVLQIHGSHDTSILLDVARQSNEWVESDYEFYEFKNTGHLIPADSPAELNDRLINWLTKLAA
jgi:pimeloyl-ACP methyl ester carboxylesterase